MSVNPEAPGPLAQSALGRLIWKRRYALSLLYIPLFLAWFMSTEHRTREHETSIRCDLDDAIPFREEWILAYGAWFPYLLGFAAWLYRNDTDRSEYKRSYYMLVTGMTICLIIYEIFPNRQDLQPASYPRENLFTEMVAKLQAFDNQSNVFPSMHVFSTLAVNDAIQHSKLLKHPRIVRPASWALTGLISASTVFLKQHSVLDGVAAAGLFAALKAAPKVVRSATARRPSVSRTPNTRTRPARG